MNISWGVKAADAEGSQPYHLRVRACPGLCRDRFTFYTTYRMLFRNTDQLHNILIICCAAVSTTQLHNISYAVTEEVLLKHTIPNYVLELPPLNKVGLCRVALARPRLA
jgi:hypothetical protein